MTMRSIPFFSLERQTSKLRSKLMSTVEYVIDSQQFIGGPFVEQFEQKVAHYFQANHVIACNSGTDALWMALHALGTPKDAIVLTTPFSFIASSSEVAMLEAHPVFIDVDAASYNISPVLLQAWLDENAQMRDGKAFHKTTNQPIVGIVTVDLFGQLPDYQAIRAIADAWKLWIVEDACQAIGAQLDGKKAGTFGDIAAFSFYPTKNLGAFGDAGCCTTNNPELAEKLLVLRNHGRKSMYNYLGLGINSRLDAMQAAVLSLKLEYLETWNTRRRQIAQVYNQELAHVPFIKTPTTTHGTHVYHQYCIQVVDANGTGYRDQLVEHLTKHGVNTRIFYEKSFTDIAFLNLDPRLKTECPVTHELTQTILALPIWPEMTDEEVEYVVHQIKTAPIQLIQKPQAASSSHQCAC
jgi:dTDP-4-amino-4,6-dideoxygalactose transaminase